MGAGDATGAKMEDVTVLPKIQVKGLRPEEFGFRIWGQLVVFSPGNTFVMVQEVIPHTAAAKAGLRPGEFIVKFNGQSPWLNIFKLPKLQELHWTPPGPGKTMTCTFEVRAPGAKESRMVTMVLPSPAPHWGDEKWSAPAGRSPAAIREAGPLAALAREVLDNGIWTIHYDPRFLEAQPLSEAPLLGYRWRIEQPSGSHDIWVTQQRGKTEILLAYSSPATGYSRFLTSPSGAMDKARCQAPGKKGERREFSPEEVRAQFEAEIDFWLHQVGRVTGRWPFEALAGATAAIDGSGKAGSASGKVSGPLAGSFLKLPAATAAQKELFLDALGKIGLDEDVWTFTETSRSLDDDRVTTVRYDPSKPPAESSELLKVDGKVPKAAYLQQWRNEGHGPLPGLGELRRSQVSSTWTTCGYFRTKRRPWCSNCR